MTHPYLYVGPVEIADGVHGDRGGFVVDSMEKVQSVLRSMDGYRCGESFTITLSSRMIGTCARSASRRFPSDGTLTD